MQQNPTMYCQIKTNSTAYARLQTCCFSLCSISRWSPAQIFHRALKCLAESAPLICARVGQASTGPCVTPIECNGWADPSAGELLAVCRLGLREAQGCRPASQHCLLTLFPTSPGRALMLRR